MKELLAALAALTPIIASLFVAGAALLRHVQNKEAFDKRVRVEERYREDLQKFTEDEHRPPGNRARYVRRDEPARERKSSSMDPEWKARVLRRGRLEKIGVSYRDYQIEAPARALLEEQPLSKRQLRDQWILIIGAAVGVVFLAASLLAPS